MLLLAYAMQCSYKLCCRMKAQLEDKIGALASELQGARSSLGALEQEHHGLKASSKSTGHNRN